MKHAWLGAAIVLVASVGVASAQAPIDWATYDDTDYGFSADLPYGLFEPLEQDGGNGLTLVQTNGSGQISIYGGDAAGLTLAGFEERLSAGEDVRDITYRASGNSWFVLSGFYDQPTGEPLIFYTKVLLSSDRQRFSAFEVSYDRSEKPLFDGIVDRIEDSFTRPSSR
jgi:hypothetical protein